MPLWEDSESRAILMSFARYSQVGGRCKDEIVVSRQTDWNDACLLEPRLVAVALIGGIVRIRAATHAVQIFVMLFVTKNLSPGTV